MLFLIELFCRFLFIRKIASIFGKHLYFSKILNHLRHKQQGHVLLDIYVIFDLSHNFQNKNITTRPSASRSRFHSRRMCEHYSIDKMFEHGVAIKLEHMQNHRRYKEFGGNPWSSAHISVRHCEQVDIYASRNLKHTPLKQWRTSPQKPQGWGRIRTSCDIN